MVSEPNPGPEPARVALVTGGARGHGEAVVRALAARGWALAIHAHASLAAARALAAELAAAGTPALALTADLRDDGATGVMVRRVVERFGRLDAAVCCAALRRPAPAGGEGSADLRAHVDISCGGAFTVARELAAALVGRPGALVAVAGPAAGPAAAAARGALVGLTAALAEEFAPRVPPLRMSVVLPGPATTSAAVAAAVLELLDDPAAGGVRRVLDDDG